MEIKLDQTDLKLLNLIQENSKRPIKELAARLDLSIGPVHERLKKLEKLQLIKKYVALIDFEKAGKQLTNYCQVSLSKHSTKAFEDFEDFVKNRDEILECSYVSGDHDYLLKIVSSNVAEYQNFITKELSSLNMIGKINSLFVMKYVKYKTSIKL